MPLERGIVSLDNIYLALDFPTGEDALNFLKKNELAGVSVKVGMELFYREGPSIVSRLKEKGHKVFLDLKLHDIPNTVYHAMKNLASLDLDLVNVHAFGGGEMISRAKEGLLAGSSRGNVPSLIAVTVLTSFDETSFRRDLQIAEDLPLYALHLADMAKEQGADGVVCSVQEAAPIKKLCGQDFLTITPGIRLATDDLADQRRVASPRFARENSSDILVVGRPITRANNPKLAYEEFVKEWKIDEKTSS